MKYKDIATKYGVTINTVKSWKQRYGWIKGSDTSPKKSMHTKEEKDAYKSSKVCTQRKVVIDDGTEETFNNENLTPKEQLFCVYYIKSFNATQSYLKAYGGEYGNAMREGSKLLRKPDIREEIARLREIKRQQIICMEDDLVEYHMRIAFSDMGDYVTINRGEGGIANVIQLTDSSNVDTQLIQEVKQGKSGVSIKLVDKHKSLEWLDRHFLYNPMDRHKQEYDRKKLEIEQAKIDMQIKDTGTYDETEDNQLLESLSSISREVFNEDANTDMGGTGKAPA